MSMTAAAGAASITIAGAGVQKACVQLLQVEGPVDGSYKEAEGQQEQQQQEHKQLPKGHGNCAATGIVVDRDTAKQQEQLGQYADNAQGSFPAHIESSQKACAGISMDHNM